MLGLHDVAGAAAVPRLDGAAGLCYSLITDYELGGLKALTVPAHLTLDAAKGLFMALSPWLFGFPEVILAAGQSPTPSRTPDHTRVLPWSGAVQG